MSTVEEAVRHARNPQEALLFIAQGIDKLLKQDEPDPWRSDAWVKDPGVPSPDDIHLNSPKAKVEALKAELEKHERGSDEHRALEARLRLAMDELNPPPPEPNYNLQRSVTIETPNGSEIVLPKANTDTQDERRKFAEDSLKLDEHFSKEIIESYVKGGPLVLYYGDRDFVMGLPDDFKRAMVRDVIAFSPAEAEEMGRDVLKNLDPEANRDVTMEALNRGR